MPCSVTGCVAARCANHICEQGLGGGHRQNDVGADCGCAGAQAPLLLHLGALLCPGGHDPAAHWGCGSLQGETKS